MSIISFLVLTAIFVAAAVGAALALHALVTVVRNDGYYPRRRPSSPVGAPPRSHHDDCFAPRSRIA